MRETENMFFKCPKCNIETSIWFLIDNRLTGINTSQGHYLECPQCQKRFNVDKMFEKGKIYRKMLK